MVIPEDPPEVNYGDEYWWDDHRVQSLLDENKNLHEKLIEAKEKIKKVSDLAEPYLLKYNITNTLSTEALPKIIECIRQECGETKGVEIEDVMGAPGVSEPLFKYGQDQCPLCECCLSVSEDGETAACPNHGEIIIYYDNGRKLACPNNFWISEDKKKEDVLERCAKDIFKINKIRAEKSKSKIDDLKQFVETYINSLIDDFGDLEPDHDLAGIDYLSEAKRQIIRRIERNNKEK